MSIKCKKVTIKCIKKDVNNHSVEIIILMIIIILIKIINRVIIIITIANSCQSF